MNSQFECFESVWGWESHSRIGDLKVLRDSRKFRVQLQGSKHLALGRSLYHLEIYWSVDVQNRLTWPIWTSSTQVMAKRKVRSQTGNLTPDHGKSGINTIPLRAGGVWHVVGKLSTRDTTLVETSSPSKVCTRSYSPTKLQDSHPWRFRDSRLGVPRQKAIWMPLPQSGTKYTIWGKVMTSLESRSWWVLWVHGCPWLVLALKVLQKVN
jgi:hypothetical protein